MSPARSRRRSGPSTDPGFRTFFLREHDRPRLAGIGPQIGYILPIGTTHQGYLNLKGYKEFDAEHRADGWNVWLTFAISPAAPTTEAKKPMITK